MHMLTQILTHTPVYVWAILALLVYRGVIAMREREISFNKLFIVPAIMLALSLQDIGAKFGFGGTALAAWGAGAAVMAALVWKFSSAGIAAGSAPGMVLVRGSRLPLAMMMAVFFTKYVASVALVMQPAARQDALFTVAVCALFGVFNGYFLGRLARDVTAFQGSHAQLGAKTSAAA